MDNGGSAYGAPRGAPGAGAADATQTSMRDLIEEFERQLAEGMEQLVAGEGFSQLLSRVTENLIAFSKVRSDTGELMLRNMRLAGQSDINRLARQLARTEDKIELLLQAVERLEDAQRA